MIKRAQKLLLLDRLVGLLTTTIAGMLGAKVRSSSQNSKKREFKIGKARWIGLALLSGFMAVRVFDPSPLQTVRLKVFDYYQNITPREILKDSPVVIIDLDEDSLMEIGQWPWPRNQLAQLVSNAFKYGTAVLGFDIIFAEPDRMNGDNVVKSVVGLDKETIAKLMKIPKNDAIFGQTIKSAKRIVVGQTVLPIEREYEDRKPLKNRVFERQAKGAPRPQKWVTEVSGILRNVPDIERMAAGHGLLALEPEVDGIVRRVPAFFRNSDRLYPALGIEVMRLAAGRRGVVAFGGVAGIEEVKIGPKRQFTIPREILDDINVPKLPYSSTYNRLLFLEIDVGQGQKKLIHRGALAKVSKKYRIRKFKPKANFNPDKLALLTMAAVSAETDRNGRMWPYFSKTDAAKYVSAKDVLSGSVDPLKLRGKIALIGTSAAGLLDIKTVPTERFIPGVEIHAQLIESVLTQQFLTRPGYADAAEMALALVAGLIIIVLVPSLGAKWSLLFFVFVSISAGAASWLLFSEERVLIDAAFGITAVLIIYVTLTYLGYSSEEAQRRQTRDAFSKYLSPAMVESVVEDPSLLTLGGSKREMTLLFCDVRGFTSISELFDAEGLTVLINKLLTPLTDIILQRNGTIDKYMGDCIMAFWNAPLDDIKHAEDGCRSALAMVQAMAPLNARLKQEAREEGRKHLDLKVGLGLNSGEAVVGNMGTAQRMDYSVLGDTVNTAARLEGQSKTYGVDIVIGPNTYEHVEEFAIIELDLIQVKGKTVGLQIYALLGDEEIAKDPVFISIKKTVSEMIRVYQSQDWDKAKNLIQKVRDAAEAAADQEVGPLLAVKAASSDRFRLDVLCDLYESRIRQYEVSPPPKNWDGVFIATTK
ncbi:MAG: hypothetical protein CBD27_00910 [Rhodospirillaceae bacterium TMED167]|nr:MAG: hypothetical protein CBD27_00910 [Rhodospirillaceae bacterium TMED167]